MTPTTVEYGKRYSDDSGWELHVSMEPRTDKIWIDITGERLSMTFEEMHWLLEALMRGRDALGMDKFVMPGPSEPGAAK